jgi:hypothetical protein
VVGEVEAEKSDFEELWCLEEASEVPTIVYFWICLEIIFNLVSLLYGFWCYWKA